MARTVKSPIWPAGLSANERSRKLLKASHDASPKIVDSGTEFQQGGIVPTLMNAKSAREVKAQRSRKPSSVEEAILKRESRKRPFGIARL